MEENENYERYSIVQEGLAFFRQINVQRIEYMYDLSVATR
jgi:hypothetical protein